MKTSRAKPAGKVKTGAGKHRSVHAHSTGKGAKLKTTTKRHGAVHAKARRAKLMRMRRRGLHLAWTKLKQRRPHRVHTYRAIRRHHMIRTRYGQRALILPAPKGGSNYLVQNPGGVSTPF